MSLADACLVCMADSTGLPICTLDSDFTIYRARRNAIAAHFSSPLTAVAINSRAHSTIPSQTSFLVLFLS